MKTHATIRLNGTLVEAIEGTTIDILTPAKEYSPTEECGCEGSKTIQSPVEKADEPRPQYVVAYGYWEVAGAGIVYCVNNYGSVQSMQAKGQQCYGNALTRTTYWNGAGYWVDEPMQLCQIFGAYC